MRLIPAYKYWRMWRRRWVPHTITNMPVLGDAGIYSFYPGKVATCGEGGVIVTHDRKTYESLLDIRNHGIDKMFGTNLRLAETSAAIGTVQMQKTGRVPFTEEN